MISALSGDLDTYLVSWYGKYDQDFKVCVTMEYVVLVLRINACDSNGVHDILSDYETTDARRSRWLSHTLTTRDRKVLTHTR